MIFDNNDITKLSLEYKVVECNSNQFKYDKYIGVLTISKDKLSNNYA